MKRFASATQKSYVVTTTFAKLESAKKKVRVRVRRERL